LVVSSLIPGCPSAKATHIPSLTLPAQSFYYGRDVVRICNHAKSPPVAG
jgi:hypothetical protein